MKKPSFMKSGEFYRVLNERVRKLIPNDQRNDQPAVYFKVFFFLALYFALFFGILTVPSTGLKLVFFMLLGVTISAIGFNLFHDSIHGSLSANKKVNLVFAHISCSLLGASRYLWFYKHNVLHHQYPNIQDWDDDLETRNNLRLTQYQPKGKKYYYQYLYSPFIYGLTTLEWNYVKDFVQYFSLRMNENQKIPAFTRGRKIEFWTAKVTYVLLLVVLPLLFLNFWVWLAGTFLMHFASSLTLASIFQLAHINNECEIKNMDSGIGTNGLVGADWAEHQLNTTLDYAVNNRALTWFSGGLNLQVPHHLFPGVSHYHYAKIQKVIESTAKEFNLSYHVSPTYLDALRSHLSSLKKLGQA